jgi:hypothetical protein
MSDIELPRDDLERHEHLAHNPDDHHARRTSVLIGVLAAGLALADMTGRSAQNAYLSHHITASDDYAFFQARQTRMRIAEQTAVLLQAYPNAADENVQKAVAEARAEAKRVSEDSEHGNGLAQLQAKADAEAKLRGEALERYELFERVTSGLQIAIVLASVSVVTKIRTLVWIAAALGAAAAAYAGLGFAGLV